MKTFVLLGTSSYCLEDLMVVNKLIKVVIKQFDSLHLAVVSLVHREGVTIWVTKYDKLCSW
jgi:hypothetical protein